MADGDEKNMLSGYQDIPGIDSSGGGDQAQDMAPLSSHPSDTPDPLGRRQALDQPNEDAYAKPNIEFADDGNDDLPTGENEPDDSDDDSSGLSDEVVSRARELGLSDDELKGYKSDDDIAVILDIMDREQIALDRISAGQLQSPQGIPQNTNFPAQQQQQGQYAHPAQQQSPPPMNEGDDFPFDFSEVSIDEDADPEVAKAFGQMKKLGDFAKQLYAQNSQLQSMHRDLVNAIVGEHTINALDSFVSSKGDDYADLLGSGRTSTLKNRVQRETRLSILRKADALRAGYQATGGSVPPIDSLIEEASHIVLAPKAKQIARREATQRTRDRNSQGRFVPTRGTRSRSHESNGDPRAAMLDQVKRFQRMHGG